jgi:hypothetical protein
MNFFLFVERWGSSSGNIYTDRSCLRATIFFDFYSKIRSSAEKKVFFMQKTTFQLRK